MVLTTLSTQFVQCLSNPTYLSHLAAQKLLDRPSFIAYLNYLQYWKQPQYARYLTYPGPTLRALELLQQERFRREIISPALAEELSRQWSEVGVKRLEVGEGREVALVAAQGNGSGNVPGDTQEIAMEGVQTL